MSVEVGNYLFSLLLMSIIANLGISLYGVFRRPSLTKKIISLTIFSDTANVLAIIVGYRKWPTGWQPSIPPVLTTREPTPAAVASFANSAVDPLPQALVLTAVVIGLAVTVFLVFLSAQVYRLYGTLDVRKIRRLRG